MLHRRFWRSSSARTRELNVGDGLDSSNDMGPVISEASCRRITGWIDKGVADGATVLVDGRSSGDGRPARSSFVGPDDPRPA